MTNKKKPWKRLKNGGSRKASSSSANDTVRKRLKKKNIGKKAAER